VNDVREATRISLTPQANNSCFRANVIFTVYYAFETTFQVFFSWPLRLNSEAVKEMCDCAGLTLLWPLPYLDLEIADGFALDGRGFATHIPGLGMKTFLVLTAAIALAACSTAKQTSANSTPAEKLGWQMAIHERTFMDFPLYEAMDKTAALGLHYMSLSANVKLDGKSIPTSKLTAEQIAGIKKHLADKGLTLVNAYVPLPADEASCRKEFEFAKKMGIDILVGEPSEDALDTIEKLCKEYNIRVAIHDHPQPSRYWNPTNVLAAIKGRGPLMGACADTGHWVRSGLDPVECLKTLEGHVFCLHFKDLSAKSRKAHDVPWGTGVSNCKGMMEELKRQGFHGAFCVEYEYHYENSMPEVAECVKFFNKTCDELAPR
jgi:sugar phosphate isomerase/epimerase